MIFNCPPIEFDIKFIFTCSNGFFYSQNQIKCLAFSKLEKLRSDYEITITPFQKGHF